MRALGETIQRNCHKIFLPKAETDDFYANCRMIFSISLENFKIKNNCHESVNPDTGMEFKTKLHVILDIS